MDFSKFRKVQTNQTSTVLEHPDGHKIRVAHAGLSPEMQKKLHELPVNYANGGMAKPEDGANSGWQSPDSTPDEAPTPSEPGWLESKSKEFGNWAKDNALSTAGEMGSKLIGAGAVNTVIPGLGAGAPLLEQASSAPPEPAQAAPTNVDLGGQQQQQGLNIAQLGAAAPLAGLAGMNMQMAGLKQQGIVQGQLGEAEAKAAHERQQSLTAVNQQYQQSYSALQEQRQHLMSDYMNGHIDPTHYTDSMSGGQKTATAIGLLLSGIGSGLTGQENLASKYLQQQIDRDIDAQKTNLGKKKTLLDANMQEFGNLKDATMMTKAHMLDFYSAQIQEAAATSKGPMAKAIAQVEIGKLKQQADMMTAQVAQKQALLGAMGSGQVAPSVAVRMLVDEKHQAKAYEEVAEHEKSSKAMNQVVGAMDQITKLQSAGNRLGSPLQSKSQIDALNLGIDSLTKEMFGKMSDNELHLMGSAKINYSDSPETIARKKQVIINSIEKGMSTPILDSYGIKLPKAKGAAAAKVTPR